MNSIEAIFKNCCTDIQGLVFFNCATYSNCIVVSFIINKFSLKKDKNPNIIRKTLYTFSSCSFVFQQDLHTLYNKYKNNYIWLQFSENDSQQRLFNFLLSHKFSNNNLVQDAVIFNEYLTKEIHYRHFDAKRFERSKKARFRLSFPFIWTLNLYTVGLDMGLSGCLAQQSLFHLGEILPILTDHESSNNYNTYTFIYKGYNERKVEIIEKLFRKLWKSSYSKYITCRQELFKLLKQNNKIEQIDFNQFLVYPKYEIGNLLIGTDDAPPDSDLIPIHEELHEMEKNLQEKEETLIKGSQNKKLIEINFSNAFLECINEIQQLDFINSNVKWQNFLKKLENFYLESDKNIFLVHCIESYMKKDPSWSWIHSLFHHKLYSFKNNFINTICKKIEGNSHGLNYNKAIITCSTKNYKKFEDFIKNYNDLMISINSEVSSVYYLNNKVQIIWYKNSTYSLEHLYLYDKRLNKDYQWINSIVIKGCDLVANNIKQTYLTKNKLKEIFTELINNQLLSVEDRSIENLKEYIIFDTKHSLDNYFIYDYNIELDTYKGELSLAEPKSRLNGLDFNKKFSSDKIGYIHYYNKYPELLDGLGNFKSSLKSYQSSVIFDFYKKIINYLEGVGFSDITITGKQFSGCLKENIYLLTYKEDDPYILHELRNFIHIKEIDGYIKIPFYQDCMDSLKALKQVPSEILGIRAPSSRTSILTINSTLQINQPLIKVSELSSIILKKNYKIPNGLKFLVQFADRQTKRVFLESLVDITMIDLVSETSEPYESLITLDYCEKVLYCTNPLCSEFIVLEECRKDPKWYWLYIDSTSPNLKQTYKYYIILKSFLEDGFFYDVPYEVQKIVFEKTKYNFQYKYNITLNALNFYSKVFNKTIDRKQNLLE